MVGLIFREIFWKFFIQVLDIDLRIYFIIEDEIEKIQIFLEFINENLKWEFIYFMEFFYFVYIEEEWRVKFCYDFYGYI